MPDRPPAMLRRFAAVILLLNLSSLALAVSMPALLRALLHLQYYSLGLSDAVNRIAAIELRAMAPVLILDFLLSLAGIVAAVGLWSQRRWARRGWLVLCLLWLIFALAAVWLDANSANLFRLLFRLVLLAISLRVLLSAPAPKNPAT